MKSKNNIPAIVGKLSDSEKRFIVKIIEISQNIKTFLYETKMSPDQFCEHFKIGMTSYNKFINGEWNYSLSEISTLEYLWTEHRRGQLKVEIIKVIDQEKQTQNQK